MKIALTPGTILWRGRRQTVGDKGLIERIDIVNTEDRTAPPGRGIVRGKCEIDKSVSGLQRRKLVLRSAIDQRETQGGVKGNSLGHGPDDEGHGADMVHHGQYFRIVYEMVTPDLPRASLRVIALHRY